MKLLEENVGGVFQDIGMDKSFLHRSPKPRNDSEKSKNEQMRLCETENVCSVKKMISRVNRDHNFFPLYFGVLVSRIYDEMQKLTLRKQNYL